MSNVTAASASAAEEGERNTSAAVYLLLLTSHLKLGKPSFPKIGVKCHSCSKHSVAKKGER